MSRIERIVFVVLLVFVIGLIVAAIQPFFGRRSIGQSSRSQDANNLKQLALALYSYCDEHGELPPAIVTDKTGKPLYSWRVLILPYIDQTELYSKFHLDEPWDSPHNIQLLKEMPSVFARQREEQKKGLTPFRVFVGPGTAFERGGLKLNDEDFPDGRLQTMLVVEHEIAVRWTAPEEIIYDPLQPPPRWKGMYDNSFLTAFAAGNVDLIPQDVSDADLRALITRNGGEVVDINHLGIRGS